MTISTFSTSFSTAPDRSDPTTFSDRADSFVVSMVEWSAEANTIIGQMNADIAQANTDATTASNSATAAAAAGNFQGAWSSATGAASAGESYSHNSSVWALVVAAADITATEPSASNSDWVLLSAPDVSSINRTASGAISEGDALTINSNGTVSTVSSSAVSESATTLTPPYTGTCSDSAAVVYHEAEDCVVYFYIRSTNLYYRVTTFSGTTPTYGTETLVENSVYSIQAVYLRNSERIVFTYGSASATGFKGNSMSVNGTARTASVGTLALICTANNYTNQTPQVLVVGNHDEDKVVFINGQDSTNSSYPTCYVGTVSGTTTTFGSAVTANTYSVAPLYSALVSNEYGTIIWFGSTDASNHIGHNIGTVSGTTVTFGGIVQTDSNTTTGNIYFGGGSYSNSITKQAQSFMHFYRAGGRGIAITWNGSTPTIGQIAACSYNIAPHGVYNPYAEAWVFSAYEAAVTTYAAVYPIDNAFGSTSFTTQTTVNLSSAAGSQTRYVSSFDPVRKQTYIVHEVTTTGLVAYVFKDDFTDTNVVNFIGFAQSGAADGETVAVNGFSQINDDQSGLTIGKTYYVGADGSLTATRQNFLYPYAGKAISTTEIQLGAT